MSFTAWFSSFTFGFISIILLYVSICSVFFFLKYLLSSFRVRIISWLSDFSYFTSPSMQFLRLYSDILGQIVDACGPSCALLDVSRQPWFLLTPPTGTIKNVSRHHQMSPRGSKLPLFPVENHFSNDEFSLEILTYLTYSCLKLMFILFWNTTRILKHLIFNFSTLWALPIVFKTQNTWLLFYITDICLDLLMYLFVSFLYFFLHIITSIWEWFPSA